MAVPVIMPKMEMSQETAKVIAWLVEEGQQVAKGDPLLEVETDKVAVEIEAPADGILAGIDAPAGTVVPVTAVIAHILAPGEALPAGSAPPEQAQPAGEGDSRARATPVARRLAAELGVDLAAVTGSGPGGRISKADVARAADQQAAMSDRPRATPAARKAARDAGIDLTVVPGSGPRGRIQRDDVLAAARQQPAPEVPPAAVPLEGMRATIARRLTESWQTTPHITLTAAVDMSASLALREELNRQPTVGDSARVTVTAFLVKACAWALRRHPLLNASLRDNHTIVHQEVNLGVAVALPDGLIVPVIRQADRLGLGAIAREIQALTERAREGRLSLADVSDGTFTLSNLGMHRVDHFTAIINPPQSAILAVGRIAKRQVVVEAKHGDELAIRPVLTMTLSADHRVIDGAVAAHFLSDLVAALEQPGLMLW